MKITITSYDLPSNYYHARIDGQDVHFDPFVSGILNGEEHNPVLIQELEGQTLDLDLFQTTSGYWLLTLNGEKQFKDIIESI